MRIVISPAKKMRIDTESFACEGLPRFLPETEQLLACMRKLSYAELKALWKCSDSIAVLNADRLRHMNLRENLTPALFAYEGIQYQYMAPGVFTYSELDYVREHLRILSGFYGVLKPFDGVTSYRLEMQARLASGQTKDLYAFWGSRIAESLFSETDCILNLASMEYSRCVSAYRTADVRLITCVFGERTGGKIIEKGTLCKMARGEMVRYMAEHRIEDPEQLRFFDRLGYRFSPKESDESTYIFIKEA
ncbi:MAG: peroxide stress protein YaaA [Hominenteromicrobium sp.]